MNSKFIISICGGIIFFANEFARAEFISPRFAKTVAFDGDLIASSATDAVEHLTGRINANPGPSTRLQILAFGCDQDQKITDDLDRLHELARAPGANLRDELARRIKKMPETEILELDILKPTGNCRVQALLFY